MRMQPDGTLPQSLAFSFPHDVIGNQGLVLGDRFTNILLEFRGT